MKSTNKTKFTVMVGLFSGIAFLLQVLGTMMGIKVGGFLDVEISDLPALIISLAYGPIAGIVTELIKNILHCTMSSTGFVGELANFVMNGTFCFTAGIIYKYKKSFKGAILALSCGTLALALAGVIANFYIMLPLYMPDAELTVKLNLVLYTILPFNLVRGAVLSLITIPLYKKISKLIK